MSSKDVPDPSQTHRFSHAATIWSLIAAGVFLGSAALQLVASLQRWVVFRYSRGEFWAEDHLVDYYFPMEPWENIGTAAQFFGAGTLILALGIPAMAFGALAMPRRITHDRAVAIILNVADIVIALLVAGSFAIHGAHALVSGITGTPSPLHEYGALDWIGLVGLIALGMRWGFRSPAAMMACVFLIGTTSLGYFIAAFQIAPIFAGYVSHDTTPWTETIIAVWTAVAGVAMIFAAVDATRRGAQRAAGPVADAAVPTGHDSVG